METKQPKQSLPNLRIEDPNRPERLRQKLARILAARRERNGSIDYPRRSC